MEGRSTAKEGPALPARLIQHLMLSIQEQMDHGSGLPGEQQRMNCQQRTQALELQRCFLPHKRRAVYLLHWEHGHTPHAPSRKQHPMHFMAKVCSNAAS